MSEHILFLTGRLAEKHLIKVIQSMEPTPFSYVVHQIGINVAALMTTDLVKRRLKNTLGANRIILPGRCRGNVEELSTYFGIPVERGPEELKDLPAHFGKPSKLPNLDRYDVRIFAEIVDAPQLSVDAILTQARQLKEDGADVIDLGCLPSTPFPHLEESIKTLKQANFSVSIDSLVPEELLRGGRAGADYLLSLHEDSLWLANEVSSTPILIPKTSNDLDSLYRAMETLGKTNKPFIADPILNPIHSGFTESIVSYHTLRKDFQDAEILMGIGNLTELTHADTAGITVTLMGIISELHIKNILTTQVSEHCRKAIREADIARRILFIAREDNVPPQHIDEGLIALHERKPFLYDLDEIKGLAGKIKDPSYRIQTTDAGIHIYNRDGLYTASEPFDLFPRLGVEADGGHAFYLGVELARAQIAFQLGKRYEQDEELTWGCAVERQTQDLLEFKKAGPTMRARNKHAVKN